jgi:hypothetical protein
LDRQLVHLPRITVSFLRTLLSPLSKELTLLCLYLSLEASKG